MYTYVYIYIYTYIGGAKGSMSNYADMGIL